MKTKRGARILSILLAILQAGASAYAVIKISNTGLFSTLWIAIISSILFLLLIAVLILGRKRPIHIIGIVLSIFLCAALYGSAAFIEKTDKMASEMTKSMQETADTFVVVNAKDRAEDISSAQNYLFGYMNTSDADITETLLKITKNTHSPVHTMQYDDRTALLYALYRKDVKALICDRQDILLYKNIDGAFNEKVKIIGGYAENKETRIEPNTTADGDVFTVYINSADSDNTFLTNGRNTLNLVCRIDKKAKNLDMIYIPGDYYVSVGNGMDMLDNTGIYGTEKTMSVLENLYGIEIDYYARIEPEGFAKLIDMLGGVYINNADTFVSEADPEILFAEGKIKLSGKDAFLYCQEYRNLKNGEADRVYHQKALAEGISDALYSTQNIFNYKNLSKAFAESVKTNLDKRNIISLLGCFVFQHGQWNVNEVIAGGSSGTQTCLATGEKPVTVTVPGLDSVNEIRGIFQQKAIQTIPGVEKNTEASDAQTEAETIADTPDEEEVTEGEEAEEYIDDEENNYDNWEESDYDDWEELEENYEEDEEEE